MDVDESTALRRQQQQERLEAFAKTVALGVPVSTILSVGALCELEIDALSEVFDGLVGLAEELLSSDNVGQLQRALLDVVELLVTGQGSLCTEDRGRLPRLRKTLARFEDVMGRAKSKVDYRAFSIFMENKVGEVSLNENGPMCSEFNKIKSKLARGTVMTWEEREKTIEMLLSNVNDKRRGFLVEGRTEVRGYRYMSDQELQAWSTLAGELTGAPLQGGGGGGGGNSEDDD